MKPERACWARSDRGRIDGDAPVSASDAVRKMGVGFCPSCCSSPWSWAARSLPFSSHLIEGSLRWTCSARALPCSREQPTSPQSGIGRTGSPRSDIVGGGGSLSISSPSSGRWRIGCGGPDPRRQRRDETLRKRCRMVTGQPDRRRLPHNGSLAAPAALRDLRATRLAPGSPGAKTLYDNRGQHNSQLGFEAWESDKLRAVTQDSARRVSW